MAGNEYIALGTSTDFETVAATQSSSGVGSAGEIVALNSAGLIDPSMLAGSGLVNLPATENIAAGAMINLYSATGVASIRNADNSTTGKPAHGWAPTAITSGNTGGVYIGDGPNTDSSSLTIGTTYFLGTVGAVVSTPPTASGTLTQRVGVAQSTTLLQVLLGPTIAN